MHTVNIKSNTLPGVTYEVAIDNAGAARSCDCTGWGWRGSCSHARRAERVPAFLAARRALRVSGEDVDVLWSELRESLGVDESIEAVILEAAAMRLFG